MIPVHVLLVEDNKADARLVTRLLADAQRVRCGVEHAEWLSSALMLVKNKAFDVVFLDLSLPDSQGIDTIVAMRRETASTPIIVLSGQEDLGVATKSMEAGADNFLVKSPDMKTDELEREILYSLERARRNITSKMLMQRSVANLTLDTRTNSTPPPPISGMASAHVNAVEDAVNHTRMLLQRNNPGLAEQVEQMLHSRGYWIAIQELRTLLQMDRNIHSKKTVSFSERAMEAVRVASAGTTPSDDPEADLLDVLEKLETT
jgi:CheY-like chemotaxis protein